MMLMVTRVFDCYGMLAALLCFELDRMAAFVHSAFSLDSGFGMPILYEYNGPVCS